MTTFKTTELRSPDGTSHALVPALRLKVVDGADAGKTYASRHERIVLGTHESADLVLSDPAVSRFHCEIALVGDRARIRDLGSRNGTLVDGVTIVEAYLHPGATIAIGGSRLAFGVEPKPVQLPVSTGDRFGGLVGRSLAMRTVFARLERAAASDSTVLLEGETGTGKEAAAEAIHAASARRGKPFVVVDCGAIPLELMESELFGHERGAFTGAHATREGAFAAAHGGTLFLDELGELAPALQPKLLRALERREIKPVGRTAYTSVDVRVIAATHRDLRAEVNSRRFRADLFYRLAVIDVHLPALRERLDDLPLLVDQLLDAGGLRARPETSLVHTPEFLDQLAAHSWPGNVRELRNYIERCVALRAIEPIATETQSATGGAMRQAKENWERAYLEDLLARHGNNVSAAARGAGIDRKQLYKMLWRNGLR